MDKWFFMFFLYFLSDLVSSVRLGDLNPFIDTRLGSIPLSTLHVDYASTPLALDGSSHKKGPTLLLEHDGQL